MANEIFTALHRSTPIYTRDLFEETDNIFNLCSTVSLKQPKCNTITYGLSSFKYESATYVMIFQMKLRIILHYLNLKTKLKNDKDQSVFAICVQECS